MTDLSNKDLITAQNNLKGHSLVLCKDGKMLFGEKRGISPMLDFIDGGIDLCGYSASDLVVGKAAAMLFVKAKIKAVYAEVLSEKGKYFLQKNAIPFSYGVLTENIINRDGTDICPMEKAVKDIDGADLGYRAIKEKLLLLQKEKLQTINDK